MSDVSVDVDDFALALDEMLKGYLEEVDESVAKAAKTAAKKGSRLVKSNAKSTFGGTGKYAASWGHKEGKKGQESYAEIGSTMPGLPHLLEKGHATLGGGRVPGRQHIAPAADETFKTFEDELKKEIGGIQ